MSEIDWIKREKRSMIQFFARQKVVIERGEDCWLYDINGKKYLDLVTGIACVSIGHGNRYFIEKIKEQMEKLIHVSNLYYTIPQIELAEKLKELTKLDKFFFCNSGTEAVEAALKISRKVTGKRKKFIAFKNSFHGRTMGSLSVTWKEKFRKPFEPLISPVEFAEYNNIEDLERILDHETSAVILELIQGESGVYPADIDFVRRIFELKEKYDFLIIFDEIQTGFGRVGEWFAKDLYKVEPDLICLAKAMANGIPIGAVGIMEELEKFIEVGDHGSTFGGNPLACSAALATIRVIETRNLVNNSKKMGKILKNGLKKIGVKPDGYGLMIGFDVDDAESFVESALKKGVLVNKTSEKRIRLLPPLIIGKEEIKFALDVFSEIL